MAPLVGRTASSAPDRWSGFRRSGASPGTSEEILETPQELFAVPADALPGSVLRWRLFHVIDHQ